MNDIEFCEDCISKADALKLNVYAPIAPIVEGEDVHWEEIILTEELRKLPSVLPKAKKGHWINGDDKCPCCGKSKFEGLYADIWADWQPKHCPNCGAKMIEPQESEDNNAEVD